MSEPEEPIYVPEPPPPGFPAYGPPYPLAYLPAGPPPAPPRLVSAPILGWLLLGAAVLAVLGAVLPWASVFGTTIVGTAGDGQLVIGFAIAIGGCALAIGFGQGRLWAALVALGFALLIVLIALVDVADVNSVASADGLPLDDSLDAASVGGGLWLTLVAGVAATGVAAVAVIRREPVGAPPCAEPPAPTA